MLPLAHPSPSRLQHTRTCKRCFALSLSLQYELIRGRPLVDKEEKGEEGRKGMGAKCCVKMDAFETELDGSNGSPPASRRGSSRRSLLFRVGSSVWSRSKGMKMDAFEAELDGSNGSPPSSPLSPRPGSSRRSFLFRVGSSVWSRSKGRQMSTYDHVKDAARYNMAEAGAYEEQRTVPPGVIGLINLGNTCFMNSSLQCLSNTIPLTDYFLGYDYRKEINQENILGTGGKLATAYGELMKQMWLGRHTGLKPSKFKQRLATFAPQFDGTYQHDAQELLAYLLDGIHEDLNRVRKKPYIEDKDCDGTNDSSDAVVAWKNYLARNKSLIVDIFQGQFRNTCQCKTCGHRNIRFETFMYLSLPITESCRTLQDCLDLYLKIDTLDGANQWYCDKCKDHVDATRKIDIWILPPVLIIHLKRFKYDDFGQVGSKNNAILEYPMEKWDFADFVLGQRSGTCYDLYAVSNHLGGLGSGHYTAHALNRFNDEWYEFNDCSYRMLSDPSEIQRSSSAYLLFYNRSEDVLESSQRRLPLIRRQSVSRPDLWPHAQVVDADFREFRRPSRRDISISPASTNSGDKDGEEERDVKPTKSTRFQGMEAIFEHNSESSQPPVATSGPEPADKDKTVAANSKLRRRTPNASESDNDTAANWRFQRGKHLKELLYNYGNSPSKTKPKKRRKPEEKVQA